MLLLYYLTPRKFCHSSITTAPRIKQHPQSLDETLNKSTETLVFDCPWTTNFFRWVNTVSDQQLTPGHGVLVSPLLSMFFVQTACAWKEGKRRGKRREKKREKRFDPRPSNAHLSQWPRARTFMLLNSLMTVEAVPDICCSHRCY